MLKTHLLWFAPGDRSKRAGITIKNSLTTFLTPIHLDHVQYKICSLEISEKEKEGMSIMLTS